MEEEVATLDLNGQVVVKGMVLAVLETLEAVDDDLSHTLDPLELAGLEEQVVAPEAADLVGDGTGGASQGTGDLAVGHAPHDHQEHRLHQSGLLLPVGHAEGLYTKVTATVQTCKPLYTLRGKGTGIESLAFVGPAIA